MRCFAFGIYFAGLIRLTQGNIGRIRAAYKSGADLRRRRDEEEEPEADFDDEEEEEEEIDVRALLLFIPSRCLFAC